MFWNDPNWKPYRTLDHQASSDEKRIGAAVRDGLSQLASRNASLERAITLLLERGGTQQESDFRIAGVDYNELRFYKERNHSRPILVRLRVEPGADVPSALYFVVFLREIAGPHAGAPDGDEKSNEYQISLLSGESAPIHEISKIFGVDLSKAEEFTDFFTSFVSGDEGPFCIINFVKDVRWPATEHSFDTEVQNRILSSWRFLPLSRFVKETPAFRSIPLRRFVEDLIDKYAPIKRVGPTGKEGIDNDLLGELIEEELSQEKKLKQRETIDASFRQGEDEESLEFVHLVGVVQYGRTFFLVLFRTHSDGRVDMVSDRPLHPTITRAPVDAWRFVPWDQYSFLVRDSYRLIESEVELLMEARRSGSKPDSAKISARGFPKERTGTSIYEGTLIVEGGDTPSSLHFERIEFMGQVSFENSILRGNVTFNRCRFLGRLNLVNTRVSGTPAIHAVPVRRYTA